MKRWENIIVHHAALDFGSALLINEMHKRRQWRGIGYHYVILNGYACKEDLNKQLRFGRLIGSIEVGRTLDGDQWAEANEEGAHALGFNANSIGICLIHNKLEYHPAMVASLLNLCRGLMNRYSIPVKNILGHCEVDPKRKPLCPGLDMDKIRGWLR